MPNNIYNNLSDDELKASYWYVTHRILLRKIGIGTLMVISLGLLLYGVISLINFYSGGEKQIDQLTSQVSQERLNVELLAEANKPKNLSVGETQVLRGKTGFVDLVVEIANPNQQWTVQSLDFYFLIGEEKTEIKQAFILPGELKYLVFFNYPSNSTAINAQLVIENIKWEKISDFQPMKDQMLNFSYENASVLSSSASGLSAESTISTVSFDVLNKTSFSFRNPHFIILLSRGNQLIAVADTYVDGLATGERRTEKINLFQNLPSSTQLQVVPDINILDPDTFKGFDLGSGELK